LENEQTDGLNMIQLIATRLSDRSVRQSRKRERIFTKTKIDCLLNGEHESESSSSLIDVSALEDDVVQKLSFDGRVYVCTNVWNESIREGRVDQSILQPSASYLFLLKCVRDLIVC
jgi:hypothetical protein